MRYFLILLCAAALAGCSWSTTAVRSQVVSYDDAIEDTTNKLLVLNILRARDKAPQHFDEIPSIHESIQASASLGSSIPFGPLNKSTQRDGLTTGFGLQVAPSFELDHLDTKDFVTGLASPIDPKFVKFWLDRGLDRRLVLLLFFSAVDIVDAGQHISIRIRNSPREALEVLEAIASGAHDDFSQRCEHQSDFQHYLRFINTLTTFFANTYTERRELAEGVRLGPGSTEGQDNAAPIKDLTTLAGLDPTKYQWVREGNKNTFTIYALETEQTALCDAGYQPSSQTGAPAPENTRQNPCNTSVYTVPAEEDVKIYPTIAFEPLAGSAESRSKFCELFDEVVAAKEPAAGKQASPANADAGKRGFRLEIRSVGEIIQFLGDLLEYQDKLASLQRTRTPGIGWLNNPLTLGYCLSSMTQGCSDVFFNLPRDACNSRFSLVYRHQRYFVPNYDLPVGESCANTRGAMAGGTGPGPIKDHTLEILSVVHQLIDLQKSAKDIRETPYIQVLP